MKTIEHFDEQKKEQEERIKAMKEAAKKVKNAKSKK